MSTEVQITASLIIEDCCICGAAIALSPSQKPLLRKNHTTFYCPNGHHNYWPQETEEERLRKELSLTQERVNRLRAEADGLLTALAKTKKEKTALVKRIGAGVCPHCHRTFQQVARHIASKHPAEGENVK